MPCFPSRRLSRCLTGLLAFLALLAGGSLLALLRTPQAGHARSAVGGPVVAVRAEDSPLAVTGPCQDTFVAHDLAHTSRAGEAVPRLFDSNGSGLAINDLDGDGRLDIVLADLAGPLAILWNRGHLQFERQELPLLRRARGVAAVDVDGDTRLDLVVTHGVAAPAFFRNQGNRHFQLTPMPGVQRPAYAMAWADLDRDGDLDLVTGSYDAGRQQEVGANYLFGASAGVWVYLQADGRWQGQQLAEAAQALAIAVWDLDDDGRPDIWVGNDFDEPDRIWLQRDGTTWLEATPFRQTAHSTMGIDRGDIDGDGIPEYFATDMKPYSIHPRDLAPWLPLMEAATQERRPWDPQVSENVLLVRAGDRYVNRAYPSKVDATGWSWSAKFGDLDHDGHLDLYVVNGMIAADLFPYLPQGELVESNQALQNQGRGRFLPAPGWGLDSRRSGRGMSMADLDGDGDLDIVVNNLNSPAQLFENRLCLQGKGLVVGLRWPGSRNPYAIGAQAILHTRQGPLLRDVRAVSGYLSGDPASVHFGVPQDSDPLSLEVHWPDGAVTWLEQPLPGHRLTLIRAEGP